MDRLLKCLFASGKMLRKNNLTIPIIKTLWLNKGVTRKMLANELGISKVAITKNIDALLEAGLVEEARGSREAPRKKSIPLSLRSGMLYSAGVLLSYEKALVEIVDNNKNRIDSFPFEYERSDGAGSCAGIATLIKNSLRRCKITSDLFAGVGIAVSGLVDAKTGSLEETAIFRNQSVPVKSVFEGLLDSPCVIMNTSSMLARTEHMSGSAVGLSSFVYFTSGYGLGMFLNGQLYTGHQNNAGEAGFMQLCELGAVWRDGRTGTLGTLKPLWEIPAKVREIAATGGHSSLAVEMAGGDITRIDHEIVYAAAAKGDRLCSQLLAESFDYIGRAVVNIAYLLNPEAFFFEPWTAACEECTLDIVRRHMKSYGAHNWKLHSKVSPAKCGYESLPSAAAELPVEDLFQSVKNVYNNGGNGKIAANRCRIHMETKK